MNNTDIIIEVLIDKLCDRTYQSELLITELTNQNFLSQNLPIRTSLVLITELINQKFLSQNLPIRTSYHKAYQSELLITELTNQKVL
jgi:hypothetical protein